MSLKKRIFICAGEYSGSLYIASTIRSILNDYPDFEVFGIGGSAVQKAGARLLYNSDSWGSIGLVEAIKRCYLIPINFSICRLLAKERPDLVLLVDYPGFNMHLARKAKLLKIPTVYLFPPRKFAKNKQEVLEAANVITHVAAEFQPTFEVYQRAGARVSFVGHPMLDFLPKQNKAELKSKYNILNNERLIIILPGSRAQEVSLMLPLFVETCILLNSQLKNLKFHILGASNLREDKKQKQFFKEALKKLKQAKVNAEIFWDGRFSHMQMADFALVASGTATMELMVYSVPMIIGYKVSNLTELLARIIFYKLPDHVGLPNLLANERVVPELLQREATKENLAKLALDMLENQELLENLKLNFANISAKLGGMGSIERLKSVIYTELGLKDVKNSLLN